MLTSWKLPLTLPISLTLSPLKALLPSRRLSLRELPSTAAQPPVDASAGAGAPTPAEDVKGPIDGAALARMVEEQAEQQGKHMP